MTDALTETTTVEPGAAATIAPPSEPVVDPAVDEPTTPDPPSGVDQPAVDADDDPTGKASSGSFGQRISRWFRQLGHRIIEAPVESFVTLAVVVLCVLFVFVQLGPGNIFSNTTPAGGDMGAHVWGPAYMRDHLLTKGRLTGWTPDWYAGYPAYQFYMVLPSLAIALLSLVIPYGIAFKLVAISGVLTLPIAAWAFAKLADLPFPAPPLFAVAGTVFLFDRSFSILGGNIPSTLAGEFSFSISLTFALLFFGFYARALRTGLPKYRGWAAIMLAICGLCHLIPFIFALIGAALYLLVMPGLTAKTKERVGGVLGLGVAGGFFYLANPDKGWRPGFFLIDWGWTDFFFTPGTALSTVFKALGVFVLLASVGILAVTMLTAGRHLLWISIPVVAIGGLLTAWWTVSFYLNHKYMNDMGWERKDDVQNALFTRVKLDPQLVDSPPIRWVLIVAGAGALLSLIWWRRAGVFLLLVTATMGLLYVYLGEGRLWNARLLPFYYLALYMLAAIGVAEVGRLIATLFARDVNRPIRTVLNVTAVAGLLLLIVVALPLRALPFGQTNPEDNSYSWGPWKTTETSFIPSWAAWNFTGYEGKPAYPEYHDIIETMEGVGQQYGCGRAMWEHEEQHDRYGTPMALMLMPFWSNGCIGSMEGLYFEASSTTPYHFINQDELSRGPSNAQRDLPYDPGPPNQTEFDLGIDHLKMLGVRYYMAISEGPTGMISMARQNKSLKEVADSGPWAVFQITDGNDLVEPLKYEPAVVTLNPADQPLSQDLQTVPNPDGSPKTKTGSPWQFMAMDWYQDRKAWDTYLAASGPDSWQQVNRGEQPKLKAEKPITVSNTSIGDDSISFDVSEPGVPVLVKMSYFPNWKVSGAEGPYRVTPNLMVVVPTDTHVEMHYGYTGVDYLGWFLTLLGLVGVVWLFRSKPVKVPDPSDPNEPLPVAETPDMRWVFDPTTGTFVPSSSVSSAADAGPPGLDPPGDGPAGVMPAGPPLLDADADAAHAADHGGGVAVLDREREDEPTDSAGHAAWKAPDPVGPEASAPVAAHADPADTEPSSSPADRDADPDREDGAPKPPSGDARDDG